MVKSNIFKLTVKGLSANLIKLKQSEGYISTENFNLKSNDEWASYIKTQLLARDKMICFLHGLLKKYMHLYKKGTSSLGCFQYKNKYICKKIKEINFKRKRRERFLKKKNFHKTVSRFTQTDDDDHGYNWDWNYQKHCNYTSKEFEAVDDIILKPDEAEKQLQVTSSDRITSSDNIEQSDDNSSEKNLIHSDSKMRLPNSQTSFHSQKDITEIELDTSVTSNVSDSIKRAEGNVLLIEGTDECKNSHDAADKSSWNATNIKEEVQKLAGEITNKLGYVFIDEIGMYYDYSSGYYYDHNTSLYYDGKSGTYFYFDYDSQKYEFHSQVSPNRESEESSSVDVHCKKSAASSKQDTEREEGECSDSEGAAEDNEDEIVIIEEKLEIAPSVRLMVMNGTEKGSLHFVTLDGGQIGREGDIQVLIKDPSVSKVHANIFYKSDGPSDHHYFIQDLGSVNGTTVQGQRLSDSRIPSAATEIGHGWEIKCGNIILSCHIHPGLLTCNECEPGLVATAIGEKVPSKLKGSKKALEKERRRQNKIIRKKFSLKGSESANAKNSSFRDRAGERRETVGSDNPYQKTEMASIDTNISRTNKGFKLLEKMGWSEGQCLGVNDTGPTEPIIPVYLGGRTGLGATPSLPFKHNFNPNKSKRDMLQIMKEKSKLMSSSGTPPIDNNLCVGEPQFIQFTPSTQSPESP